MSERLIFFSILLIVIFVNGCCSFQVIRTRRIGWNSDSYGFGGYPKNERHIRECYDNCLDCRRLYGYFKYNYTACALRCTVTKGDRGDSQCETFLVESKRTTTKSARYLQCENHCKSIPNSFNCRSSTQFYKDISKKVCLHHCKENEFDEAVKVNCAESRRIHMNLFRPKRRSFFHWRNDGLSWFPNLEVKTSGLGRNT